MEPPSTIERLKRLLDSEEHSDELAAIPADTYAKLGLYAQKLRVATTPGEDDLAGRLARRQLSLLEVMVRRLLQVRLAKARRQTGASSRALLPEERHVSDVGDRFAKDQDRFVKAVVDGQPSFFALVRRREAQRMTTVRILKRVGEIMGSDLKRYGPFEVSDVARLPAGNAQVMVASKQAAQISGEDY